MTKATSQIRRPSQNFKLCHHYENLKLLRCMLAFVPNVWDGWGVLRSYSLRGTKTKRPRETCKTARLDMLWSGQLTCRAAFCCAAMCCSSAWSRKSLLREDLAREMLRAMIRNWHVTQRQGRQPSAQHQGRGLSSPGGVFQSQEVPCHYFKYKTWNFGQIWVICTC